MEETSTQKLYWDEENEIVWGELVFEIQTLEKAIENIDAQERIRNALREGDDTGADRHARNEIHYKRSP